MPNYKALRDKDLTHPIEVVGARLRDMMPFLDPGAAAAALHRVAGL